MKIAVVSPLDSRTGLSNYSETIAMELSRLNEEVYIISPKTPPFNSTLKQNNVKIISPMDYKPSNYDITHFQLANSSFHEFQVHLLKKHQNELENSKIITTIHDARNFDALNLKCSNCFFFAFNFLGHSLIKPYDVVDKAFQKISNYLIFHNHASINEYKNRYNLNPKTLQCIPHPAYRLTDDISVSQVKKTKELNENRLVVPGYISPFKGQDILIKAVSDIKTEFKLIFMGKILDESYAIYLNELIEKENIKERVEFTGFVSDNRFIQEIDKAKAVLIPRLMSSCLKKSPVFKLRKVLGLQYLATYSTSGVLTKALASGKPVICSKDGGFLDYIDSSRGILCENNIESWKNAIQFVLENLDAVEKMSINSRKFAVENLNPEMIAKKHIMLYKKCLTD